MSIVRIFTHQVAFPNTWIVKVDEGVVANTTMKENVCGMYDVNGKLLGYNLMQMQPIDNQDGYQRVDEDLLNKLNQALHNVDLPTLTHDFTPRIVIGYIVKMIDHPDSDHLHICTVDVGLENPITIVCGAQNVHESAYVVVALDQAVLPDGKWIQSGKLRGILSHGMLCSAWELGLIKEKQKGLLLLDDTYTVGVSFDLERGKYHV